MHTRSQHGGRHELGQNFLRHQPTIDAIVDAVARTTGPILEIGAGDGALTVPLAGLNRDLLAIDIDEHRVRSLARRVPTATVQRRDALTIAFARPVIVGNIPFHITTPILRRLLRSTGWTSAILLIQWEVARKRASVGGGTMMTAQHSPWFAFELRDRVPAEHLWPQPSVDGGLLHITRRDEPLVPWIDQHDYQEFVRSVFTGRGRGMASILRQLHPGGQVDALLSGASVGGMALPRDLTVEQWSTIWSAIRRANSTPRGNSAGTGCASKNEGARRYPCPSTRERRGADMVSTTVVSCRRTTAPPFALPGPLRGVLRCPICHETLAVAGRQLRCPRGHGFDVARHGYITLRDGRALSTPGDSLAMVQARARFLGSGLYDAIARRVAVLASDQLPHKRPALIADVAGGPGYYLRSIVEQDPHALGISLDVSKPALKAAARTHPRLLAVGADTQRDIPLVDASMDVVLSIFGPRNAKEFARILRPTGTVIVVSPAQDHLTELIEPLDMLGVDPQKEERLSAKLAQFSPRRESTVRTVVKVPRRSVGDLVLMGPTGHHLAPEELPSRLSVLPNEVDVTVAVNIRAYTR